MHTLLQPGVWFRVLLLLMVMWLAGVPVLFVAIGAFRDGIGGGFTTEWMSNVFLTPDYLGPLYGTLRLSLSVSLLATAIAVALAWAMARLHPPGAGLLDALIMMPIFLSPFLGAIGWVTLGQAPSGLLNVALERLGVPSIDIATWSGAAFVMAIFFVPYAYALLRGTMDRLNPELEEAAAVAGAGAIGTVRGVVLPLLWPSLLSALIMTFVLAAEMFSIPGLLIVPAGGQVLSYEIYVQTTRWPMNVPEASAVGLALLLLTSVGMALYAWTTRVQERFITVGPKAARSGGAVSMAARLAGFALVAVFILVGVVLPVGAIVLRSLVPYFSGDLGATSFTLDNIRSVLSDRLVGAALLHSVVVTLVSTVLLLVLAFLVALGRVRHRSALTTLTWAFASLPIAVPGALFGVGLTWLYIGTPVYGTLLIIGLVMLARFMPILVRIFETGLIQLGRELDEAAAICGAPPAVITWRIRLPLLLRTIRSAMMIGGTQVFNELTASALLFTSASSVLPVVIFNYMFDGEYGRASAVALLQIAMLSLGALLVALAGRLILARRPA